MCPHTPVYYGRGGEGECVYLFMRKSAQPCVLFEMLVIAFRFYTFSRHFIQCEIITTKVQQKECPLGCPNSRHEHDKGSCTVAQCARKRDKSPSRVLYQWKKHDAVPSGYSTSGQNMPLCPTICSWCPFYLFLPLPLR